MIRAPRKASIARAFTLVEAVMSMLIVSIVLVAAMRAAGGSALTQYKSAERVTARYLAQGLLNEIRALPYEDTSSPTFGLESGELSTSKTTFDDVDDFNGWSESPPQDTDGTVMPGMTTWRRDVKVERISVTDPTQAATSETGAKKITVTVRRNNVVAAVKVAIRTKT